MKTHVYVDGFNLYYGALRHTKYRWLNIQKLCQLILPKNDIRSIKYFTARIAGAEGRSAKQARQNTFFRALGTLENTTLVFGHFITHDIWMPRADSPPNKLQFVKVVKTEEKGSDVNLATHLIRDGFKGEYDIAVLITNDSDLLEPVRVVRTELGLKVGILNPHQRPSRALARQASFVRTIRRGALKASQFPECLRDQHGTIRKPTLW